MNIKDLPTLLIFFHIPASFLILSLMLSFLSPGFCKTFCDLVSQKASTSLSRVTGKFSMAEKVPQKDRFWEIWEIFEHGGGVHVLGWGEIFCCHYCWKVWKWEERNFSSNLHCTPTYVTRITFSFSKTFCLKIVILSPAAQIWLFDCRVCQKSKFFSHQILTIYVLKRRENIKFLSKNNVNQHLVRYQTF